MGKNKGEVRGAIRAGDYLPFNQLIILGLQHTFTMFGATVLVPLLTGLDVGVALFTAGVATLLYHLVTKMKVPIFLGSSFAYIAPIALAVKEYGIPAAQGGIIVGGLIYVAAAVLVYFLGPGFIEKLLPPVVTGPMIMVIGLNLASTAVNSASKNWIIAFIVLIVAIIINIYAKGFIKLVPVIISLIVGYIISAFAGLVDFSLIAEAPWIALPNFTWPEFNAAAIGLIAPVAVATLVEHVGDVIAVGATVGEDYIKDPGLHRTLIGDGIGTVISGIIGGPSKTTYSENTGVLALTRVYKPEVMRIAAIFAILLSFIQKLGAAIRSIPDPVIGGISIVLFGMIASIGVRTVVENQVDFKQARNLIIASVILVLGIGGAIIQIGNFQMGSMGFAALVGIILNQILPQYEETTD